MRRVLPERRSPGTGPSAERNRRRRGRLAGIATPHSVGAALILSGVVVWMAINLVSDPSSFVFLVFVGVTNGAIYALIALGFSLSYALIEVINLPQGVVVVSGAAVCAYLLDTFGVTESSGFAVAIFAVLITLLLAMSFCGLLSLLIELVAYRPLSDAPRQARLVTAVGVLFIVDNVVLVWTGGVIMTFPDLLPRGAALTVVGVAYTWDKLLVLLIMGLVSAGLYFVLRRTRRGRSILAVSQDPIGAQHVGINVAATVTLGFVVVGALAGAAGELYGLYYTTVSWDASLRLTLIGFTAVILGGIGSLAGAVIGAMIIGITESFSNGFLWYSPGSDWTLSVVLSIMILLLVLRPQGILGTDQE